MATENLAAKRIPKARRELLSQYATAAGFLYGILSVSEFVEVFNHYEDDSTSESEVCAALEKLASAEDVEYSFFDGCISGPEFLPEFPEDRENAEIVREEQRLKPRYLPPKAEFLSYVSGDHREPEEPYAELKAHILKRGFATDDGFKGVDGDLVDLHEMIQTGAKLSDVMNYFTESGYHFEDIDDANAFVEKVSFVFNNTRLYENNGYTPSELFELMERDSLKPLPKEPFLPVLPSKDRKIGRNEPCPCGSGKKHKNCCGRLVN